MTAQLIIFSGLPGTGKTSLAYPLAKRLKAPLLRVDDLFEIIPAVMLAQAESMWDDLVGILLALVEVQLEIGLSVVVDSVFMGADRTAARKLAERYEAQFLPIHTFISDPSLWKQRVDQRVQESDPQDQVATWARIQVQQKSFWSWQPGTALFVDGADSFERNWTKVLEHLIAHKNEVE